MIIVFIVLALLVAGGTAAALAGRWRPEGLPPGRPAQESAPAGEPRFDVVLRGYRMDQVDEELERLHQQVTRLQGSFEDPGGIQMPDQTEDLPGGRENR